MVTIVDFNPDWANTPINIENVYKASEVRLRYVSDKQPSKRIKIEFASDILEAFIHIRDWNTIEHIEEIKMIMLNRNNALLEIANISSGGISGTVIDIRIIMQYALNSNASAVVLAHNHLSRNLNPGRADIEINKYIKTALDVFDIRLPDHLIITSEREFASIMESL